MKSFQSSTFGVVKFGGENYRTDIYVFPDGSVEERNKDIARSKFGTSHKVPQAEVSKLVDSGEDLFVVGTGQSGRLSLSSNALKFLKDNDIEVVSKKTPDAIKTYNEKKDKLTVAAIIHVTC